MMLRTTTTLLALALMAGTHPERATSAGVGSQDAPMAPTPPVPLTYGPVNYGLRLAAWFDQRRAVAYGAIRNANPSAVRYCDYLVGNFEFVEVYARRSPADAWRRIPRRTSQSDGYLSAGPGRHNIRWLGPGRLMPPGPYGGIGRHANPSQVRHTFDVNYASFVFPEEWTGDAESKLVQHMLNDVLNEESRGSRALESPPFAISLPFTPR